MHPSRGRGLLLTLAIILALLGVPSLGRLAADDGGQLVRSGAQGYSLRRPALARVTRYDPEGILHVELADHQKLLIRVHDNPGHLSAAEWTAAWLAHGVDSGDGLVEYAPRFPVLERRRTVAGGLPAETLVVAGPAARTRRTILTTASRVYVIDYPLGHEANEPLFDEMLGTFEAGTVAADSGVQVVERATASAIPALPVPLYMQTDPNWICEQIGTCQCDVEACSETYTGIGDAGCFITSQAMVFSYFAGNDFMDPGEYNACLKSAGAYSAWFVCTWGLCGAPNTPPLPCRPPAVKSLGVLVSTPTNLSILDSDLTEGHPAVALIDSGNHYAVIIGKTVGGDYIINDPMAPRKYISPGEVVEFVRYSDSVADPTLLGDVTGEGQADSTDALVILSADAGNDISQFCPMNCGDVNADGLVNSTDALVVLSYDAGISVPFPVGSGSCPSGVTPPPGCTP